MINILFLNHGDVPSEYLKAYSPDYKTGDKAGELCGVCSKIEAVTRCRCGILICSHCWMPASMGCAKCEKATVDNCSNVLDVSDLFPQGL